MDWFKRYWITIPDELVIRIERPRIFGYPMALREDVAAWCKANHMRPKGPAPEVVLIADHYYPPFGISIRGKKNAALFKTWWC